MSSRLAAVFDTNVLFSAVAWKGAPFQCVELARSGEIEGVVSREIVDELVAKLQSKLAFDPQQAVDAAVDFLGFLRLVSISGTVKGVVVDPDDDKVLETAIVANATHIVTVDVRHLIPIGTFRGIAIVSPAEFLSLATANRP